jgi:hypothetical protein
MPSFNTTVELRACVEDTVVVILVVDRSRYAVSEHALCQARERIDWVVPEKRGSARCVPLRSIVGLRCAELVELVLSCSHQTISFAQHV